MGVRRRVTDPDLPITAADITAFWEKVVITKGCWIFTGAISSPDGYGRVNLCRGGVQRTLTAHRFALICAQGEEAAKQVVLLEHKCNQPLCVRVDDEHVTASNYPANYAYSALSGNRVRHGAGEDAVARSRRLRSAILAQKKDPVATARLLACEPVPPSRIQPRLF